MESDVIRRTLYSLSALVILAIFAIGSIDSNTSQSSHSAGSPGATTTAPASRRNFVGVGEVAILRAGNSTSGVVLGSDKQAEEELTKIAVSHDQEGFAMLMLSGRAFSVPAGTKVRVLDHFGFLGTTTQVRILEGSRYGRAGFVPSEWVVPTSSVESTTPEIRKARPVVSASPKKNRRGGSQ